MWVLLLFLILLLVLLLWGGGACSGQSSAPPPNLLLVVIDTLRQDHLGCYGHQAHPTSPRIDALAASGVRVDGLIGVTSWTMPSVATLYTGLPPAAHGVMRMSGKKAELRDAHTLASEMRRAGYATACVMSNFLLREERGFDEGFDFYQDAPARKPDPHRGSSADEVARLGQDWLDQAAAKQGPWFLNLHFFDPHTSYEDQPEFSFAEPGYRGWVRGGLDQADYRQHAASASERDRAQLGAYYDEEIAEVDRALGQVLDHLATLGELDNTLVVVTSDHGEELAERGYIGHTRTLHFEQIDLPLVLWWPAEELHGVRTGLMSQRDLYATLLDLCDLPVPLGRGTSRAPWLRDGDHPPPPQQVFFEVDFLPVKSGAGGPIRKRGIQEAGRKLVLDLDSGQVQLFNLIDDPAEIHDLSQDPAYAADLKGLRAALNGHVWYRP